MCAYACVDDDDDEKKYGILKVVREHNPLGRDVELFRRHRYSPGKVGPAVKVKGSRLQLVNFLYFCTANIVDMKIFGIAAPTLQEWSERVADA